MKPALFALYQLQRLLKQLAKESQWPLDWKSIPHRLKGGVAGRQILEPPMLRGRQLKVNNPNGSGELYTSSCALLPQRLSLIPFVMMVQRISSLQALFDTKGRVLAVVQRGWPMKPALFALYQLQRLLKQLAKESQWPLDWKSIPKTYKIGSLAKQLRTVAGAIGAVQHKLA